MASLRAVRALRAAVVAVFLLGVLAVPLVAADDDPGGRPSVAVAPVVTTVPVTTTTTTPPATTTVRSPRPTVAAYRGPVTRVHGRVVDDGGRPVAGVDVHVFPDEGLAGIGRTVAGLAAGTLCASPQPPIGCRDSGRATTGRHGRYTVELLAGLDELRGSPLIVAAARAGSEVRHRVALSSASVQVPDLPLWDPGFRLEGGRASWRPVRVAGAQYTLRLTRIGGIEEDLVLGYPSEPFLEFDARVLEDYAATVVLSAKAGDLAFAAPEGTVRGPGAPPTRDRPCSLVPDDPQAPPQSYARCPLTDTDPHSRMAHRPPAHSVVIDLGASRSLGFMVVRRFDDDPLFVEVSDDGSQWVELVRMGRTTVPPSTRTALAPQPRTGRYVRFRSEERSPSFFSVDAVAVW